MLTCQKLLGALRCFSSNHSHIDTQIDIRFRKASYASRLRHLPNSSTRETRVYLVDLAGDLSVATFQIEAKGILS